MDVDEVIRFYAEYAKDYDQKVKEEKDYIAFQIIPDWVISALGDKKAQVIDLACGTGLSSALFFERGYEVIGIDVSLDMLQVAQKLPFHSLHCQSIQESLPVKAQSLDAAIMLGAMEFIRDPQPLLKEVYRLLRKEGIFGVTFPKKLNAFEEREVDIFTFEERQIEQWLKEAKFEKINKQEFQGFISHGITVHYLGYLARAF